MLTRRGRVLFWTVVVVVSVAVGILTGPGAPFAYCYGGCP